MIHSDHKVRSWREQALRQLFLLKKKVTVDMAALEAAVEMILPLMSQLLLSSALQWQSAVPSLTAEYHVNLFIYECSGLDIIKVFKKKHPACWKLNFEQNELN